MGWTTAACWTRWRDLDLWAQVQVQADELVALKPMLQDSGAKLLFDHCGRPDPAAGVGQAGFAALLSLAETGRACVKLSSLVKCSNQPYPYPDAWLFVQALLQAYTPQALVWGARTGRFCVRLSALTTARCGRCLSNWCPMRLTVRPLGGMHHAGCWGLAGSLRPR